MCLFGLMAFPLGVNGSGATPADGGMCVHMMSLTN